MTSLKPRDGIIVQPHVPSLKECEYRVGLTGSVGEDVAFPICTAYAANNLLAVQRLYNEYDWYYVEGQHRDAVVFGHVHSPSTRAALVQVAKTVRRALCDASPCGLVTLRNVYMRVDIGYALVENSDADETSLRVWVVNECDNTMLHGDILADMSKDVEYRRAYAAAMYGLLEKIVVTVSS